MISDGIHPPVTFEASYVNPSLDPRPVSTPTHVYIDLWNPGAIIDVYYRIARAIGGSSLDVSAVVDEDHPPLIHLTNESPGGGPRNVAIVESVANAAFVVSGMSGGVAYDCAAGTGCAQDADCLSGSCCLSAGTPTSCTSTSIGKCLWIKASPKFDFSSEQTEAVMRRSRAPQLPRTRSKKSKISGNTSGIMPPWSASTSLYSALKPLCVSQSRS